MLAHYGPVPPIGNRGSGCKDDIFATEQHVLNHKCIIIFQRMQKKEKELKMWIT